MSKIKIRIAEWRVSHEGKAVGCIWPSTVSPGQYLALSYRVGDTSTCNTFGEAVDHIRTKAQVSA